jgi:hypothetical protein
MRRRTAVIVVAAHALLAAPLFAQSFDYHLEETPAVSWNDVGFHDARMLSLGGVSLLASDPFAASTNPALIPRESRYSLGLSGARVSFEAMQYRGVNQGSLTSLSPPSDTVSVVSGLAGHIAIRRIGLAAGWYVNSLPRFPDFAVVTYYGSYADGVYSSNSLAFNGTENVFFVAAALPDWKGLRLGARLDYVAGRREVAVDSVYNDYFWIGGAWAIRRIEQREEQSHNTRSFSPSLGLSWQITRRWTVAGQLTWPFDGTADRTLTRTFANPTDGIFISDRQTTSDRLYRPQEATLGTALELDLSRRFRLRLGGEAAYARWSHYRYEFFGEKQPRDLRDTFGLAGGMELTFKAGTDISLRLGYRRDPQPVKEPATTLEAVTGGVGVRLWKLGLDAGAARYQGSAGGVQQNHTALVFTLSFAAK